MPTNAHRLSRTRNAAEIWQIMSGHAVGAPAEISAAGMNRESPLQRAGSRVADTAAWTLSLWFGCGLVPRAPGTAGTVGALPLYWLVRSYGPYAVAFTSLAVAALGVWASTRVARASQMTDPQFVCVDEVAGVLVTWIAAGPSLTNVALGFALFRCFDWYKPFPARACERLPGGFGIVCDDLAAGAWGAVVLLVWRQLTGT